MKTRDGQPERGGDNIFDYAVERTLQGVACYGLAYQRKILRMALRAAMQTAADPDDLQTDAEFDLKWAVDDGDVAKREGITGGDRDFAITRLGMALREPEIEVVYIEALADSVEEWLARLKDED